MCLIQRIMNMRLFEGWYGVCGSQSQMALQHTATETDLAKSTALPGQDGQKACGAHLAKRWRERRRDKGRWGGGVVWPQPPHHPLITQTDYFIKMLKYANADLVLGD